MFPDVEAEDGSSAASYVGHKGIVLVGRGTDFEFARAIDAKPCPTRTESGCSGLGEGLFEGVEALEGGVDVGG